MSDPIREAVDDALVLLAFASRKGLTVPSDDVTVIVGVAATPAGTPIEGPQAIAFWPAFSRLAKLVQPTTIESLRATENGDLTPPPADGWWKRARWWLPHGSSSRADEAAQHFMRRGMVIFFAVGVFQIYAGVGAHIVSSIEAASKELIEVQDRYVKATIALPPEASASVDPPSPEAMAARAAVDKTGADVARLANRAVYYDESLRTWNRWWAAGLRLVPGLGVSHAAHADPDAPGGGDADAPSTAPSDDATSSDGSLSVYEKQHDQAMMQASFALEAFQTFVLPFLYGALGASLFILLNLGREIESRAFSSPLKYRIRLWLGCLAGVAIGWVTGLLTEGAVKGVAPQALAFAAGYSVEIVISTMDRFVAAFSAVPVGPSRS